MSKFILMSTTSEADGIFTNRIESVRTSLDKEAFIELFEAETSSKLSDEEKEDICVSHDSVSIKLEDEDSGIKELFSLELL